MQFLQNEIKKQPSFVMFRLLLYNYYIIRIVHIAEYLFKL